MKARPSAQNFARPDVQAWLAARLDEVAASGRGQLLSVRGRRQAGKSTAVEMFVERAGVPYVYTSGLFHMPERAQLEAADAALVDSRRPLPGAGDEVGASRSWREWLSSLALAASEGPIIAVLDEFPWITAGDSAGLEGVLQAVWDRALEKLPIVLIIIGSDVAMMERLAQHDRPLFGRLREFVVPVLHPGEVAQALPGLSPFEVFDACLITGGYPRLVSDLRRTDQPVKAWVNSSLSDSLSPLVAIGRLTLDAEFADSDSAYRVLSAIGSSGPSELTLSSISSTIADPGAVAKTVQTAALRALALLTDEKRMVVRDLPAWATSNRLRRYRLDDPYLRFWFRYIERHADAIARGRGDVASGAFARDWESWRGRAIEPLVRDALERLAASSEELKGVTSVRPWWTRDGQVEVDAVAAGPERTEVLGTVKWRARGGIDSHDLAALAASRNRLPRSQDARLAAICPTGVAPASADLVFSAADLLSAWQR
ncbi:MAG: DUF234 domain-containing protein [Microbacterium sp.]